MAAKNLDRLFKPRTVAVVGAKQQNNYNWLRNFEHFTGKLYSVQIDEREIPGIEAMGIPNYKRIVDIPDEVDLVVVVAPRAAAVPILKDAIAKGVGGVSYFTSGFAETGTEEGIRIQEEMTRLARESNTYIVGPNCMGIFSPRYGVRFNQEQPWGDEATGPVGFISQSGTHAIAFSGAAYRHGLKISKCVSIGNAIILDATDYLEYLAEDPETEIIGMYLEGVNDGRRFFEVLRATCQHKPVVIWKGGLTDDGMRGTASHTASLAIPRAIWDAVVKQTGAIQVESFDELVDTIKAFRYLKPAAGRRVACMTGTGGPGVVLTDAFVMAGFRVPPLTERSYRQLESFYNVIGGYFRNPLDIGGTTRDLANLERIFQILDEDENIDALVLDYRGGPFGQAPGASRSDRMAEFILEFQARSSKPVVLVQGAGTTEQVQVETRQYLLEKGLAIWPTFQRGAKAFHHLMSYHEFRTKLANGSSE